MKKTTCVLLLLVSLLPVLKAQDFIIGVEYGMANQQFERQSDQLQLEDYRTQLAGLMLEFSPYYSSLYITSGAKLKMSELGTEMQIPLTFRIAPGKTIVPFVELGAWYDMALKDSPDDEYTLKNDIGLLAHAGVMFEVSKKLHLEVGYNYQYGITTSMEQEVLLPLNQTATEEYRQQLKGFSFRVKYRIY